MLKYWLGSEKQEVLGCGNVRKLYRLALERGYLPERGGIHGGREEGIRDVHGGPVHRFSSARYTSSCIYHLGEIYLHDDPYTQ